jgi:hypothetical protein
VSGLAQEFPGRVVAKNVDATTPENRKAVKQLGFESHGLVIRSARGDVLWKQPDHEVKVEDARAALRDLLREKRK